MLIIQAQAMGMCFGVEDAISIAHSLSQPEKVTVLGEIVHNRQVQHDLQNRGFHSQPEDQRQHLPDTEAVMVTAHGISQAYRQRLAGKDIIDTTCPLVARVHKTALRLVKEGFRLVLVGKPGHVEVLGISEDFADTVVLPSVESVPAGLGPRLAILAQTTTPADLFAEVSRQVERLHPDSEILRSDTICRPTKDRQAAIGQLLSKVDALVVVGGSNSNNTLRLVEQAQRRGLPSIRVERPEELQARWFRGINVVGLSAGTSTPRSAIEAVHRRLLEIDRSLKRRPESQPIQPRALAPVC
ncbi:4-hydroxy-3-methylbut-2-enyl diphosphate reductase [bacterium]|nr:4-hydroxy-3-methylbut-2-enyl diphosphate reductase [bacterium]